MDYYVYDVFTDKPLTGNQLAVFPDATGIPEDLLIKICREFKFSEVTYLYTPDDPKNTAKVRIFAPDREMQFAGHPAIGTAVALFEQDGSSDQILELGIGPVACHVDSNGASFSVRTPLEKLGQPDPALVAKCMTIGSSDIVLTTHAPEIASVGNPFVLVELTSRETLSAISANEAAMRELLTAHPASKDASIFAYFPEGDLIHARMFSHLSGMGEDPATGSAVAAFGAYMAALKGQSVSFDVLQGEDMGRPSRIGVAVLGDEITISGRAKKVMQGKLVF